MQKPGSPRDSTISETPSARRARRKEVAAMASSLVASGLLVVFTVACPTSGHHSQVGAWWVVQLGCGLGLVTTSTLGLRRG
jgi:phosphate/sulfate permease